MSKSRSHIQTMFRLKNGKKVVRALKRRGYYVRVLGYFYPIKTPTGEVVAKFEAVEASKLGLKEVGGINCVEYVWRCGS